MFCDAEESLKIKATIAKWKVEKEIKKRENKKFKCPYCAKTYADKKYVGAKKHLLNIAKTNPEQKKLTEYFKRKKL